MLAVADKLDKRATEAGKKIRFLIPIINASQSKNISKKIERFQSIHPELRIVVRKEDAWRSIGESDLALLSSGSSSLEAALQHVPMVAFLRIPTWHAWIARRFARVKMICLVNLLARKEIVPEFVQDRYDEDAIAKEALRLLVDRKHIQKQKNQFRRCLPELGTGDPSEKAAKLFLTWVRKKNQRR